MIIYRQYTYRDQVGRMVSANMISYCPLSYSEILVVDFANDNHSLKEVVISRATSQTSGVSDGHHHECLYVDYCNVIYQRDTNHG